MGHPYLGRPDYMTGRMEAEFNPIYGKRLPPFPSIDLYVAQAVLYDGDIFAVCDIFFVPPAAVICMPMRDKRLINWFPRVEVYVGRCAINTIFSKFQERVFHSRVNLHNIQLLHWYLTVV